MAGGRPVELLPFARGFQPRALKGRVYGAGPITILLAPEVYVRADAGDVTGQAP